MKRKNNKYKIYIQITGILNAYEPINFVTSQEPSIRLPRIQLWRCGCASNVKKVGGQAFQETSVRIMFIEAMKCSC